MSITSSITIEEARNMLALYIDAEKRVLLNQSYTIKDRTYTRADLSVIARERKKWQAIVDSLAGGGSVRVRQVLLRDI